MNYEETIELEANIKIKNQAEKIYNDFVKNVKLSVRDYKGKGRFLNWSDSNNSTYFILKDDTFTYIADFLHENYRIEVTPSAIFSAIKNKDRGVSHLESAVREKKP